MAEDRRRNEPFIEDAHRFPEDGKQKRRPPSPGPDSRRRKNQQKRRRNSVFQYIAIMFMAAFLLLLVTFMMERRQSQQQIDDLKQSNSAAQTLQGLIDENGQLKTQASELNDQIKALQQQLEAAQTQQAGTEAQVEERDKAVQAMDYFWQINEAYVRGRTTLCRQLITSMEASASGNLVECLPKENSTGTDRYSPYDRYMEIRGKVIK